MQLRRDNSTQKSMKQYTVFDWTCIRCTGCDVCGKKDHTQMLGCKVCKKSRHASKPLLTVMETV